ncbi:MAG TPA: ABC transporter substrate-binding protein, partial [Candidatus Bathyarchaeia archaeon]|nr:ABC transporter substrate-binding protein [Candidatus Bathyarchaeia archaeon]
MRAIALGLTVVGMLVGVGSPPAAAQGPIKLGFLSPLSGAIAQAGKDMYSGCELYWQESGWQLGNRKLEVILEDTEGQPATAVSKLRKLIDSDRVDLLAGVILSNVAYALVPPIE